MKLRVFFATFFILAGVFGWSEVDIDTEDIGSEKIEQPAKRTPFSFNTYVDVIGSTKIENGFSKGDKVNFAEAEAEVGMVVYYCPAYTEGARIALGYTTTYLNWSDNPWFDQNHYNAVSLIMSSFTKRLDRWFWRSQLSINFDAANWKGSYTSYDILLWGRYTFLENIGIHLGFLAQTGLRLDRVYPIIGFDWQISRQWKLNLVYPVNISLNYAFTPIWSLAIAGRNFNVRYRVNDDDIFRKALVRYTNFGLEFAIKYETKYVSANIHAGATLAGKYRIANQHNRHAHTYDLKSAGYAGAEMDVSF